MLISVLIVVERTVRRVCFRIVVIANRVEHNRATCSSSSASPYLFAGPHWSSAPSSRRSRSYDAHTGIAHWILQSQEIAGGGSCGWPGHDYGYAKDGACCPQMKPSQRTFVRLAVVVSAAAFVEGVSSLPANCGRFA